MKIFKNSSFEKNPNIVWHKTAITRRHRELLNRHKSFAVWFTGLPSSGKSTLAHAVEENLYQMGCRTFVFDGDNVRHGLCSDLGFSHSERNENIRRIGEMVKLFVDAGIIALTAFVSPFRSDRRRVKSLLNEGDFIEIYCKCPVGICEQRDPKEHYRRAREGEIKDFTGISSPYEKPEHPDLVVDTSILSIEQGVDKVIGMLLDKKFIY